MAKGKRQKTKDKRQLAKSRKIGLRLRTSDFGLPADLLQEDTYTLKRINEISKFEKSEK